MYWIVLIETALERPEDAKLLKASFMVELKEDLGKEYDERDQAQG
jgi:hypothetical protein